MPTQTPTVLIQDRAELRGLMEAIQAAPRVAVDTEFHAERRYLPELFLLQFAFDDGTSFVVDPQTVDLAPLGPILTEASCLVHAGQQDFAILWRECEARPTDVFDVQIAAGMLGMGYPTRLDDVVRQTLDVPLPASATLSDWSTRPLSKRQIAYAISDVTVLIELSKALTQALDEQGRLKWARQASSAMAAAAQRRPTVDHRWAGWEIASNMTESTVSVMTNLYAWRDQKGRDKNQPAMYMLSDGLALDIARRQPKTLDELASNRRIPQGLIRKFGREIVAVVRESLVTPTVPPFIPSTEELHRAKGLELWALAEGKRLSIAPNLLLPQRIAFEVVSEGMKALDGWRAEAIGDSLGAFMAGQTSIRMESTGPVVA